VVDTYNKSRVAAMIRAHLRRCWLEVWSSVVRKFSVLPLRLAAVW